MKYNKSDTIDAESRDQVIAAFLRRFRDALGEPEKCFSISALTGDGCKELTQAIMAYLDRAAASLNEEAAPAQDTDRTAVQE